MCRQVHAVVAIGIFINTQFVSNAPIVFKRIFIYTGFRSWDDKTDDKITRPLSEW